MTDVRIKRIYDDPADDDGCRVLADRLWPRGVSKAAARIDARDNALTPSDALRKWFHANPSQRDEFASRYQQELENRQPQIAHFLRSLEASTITLVTATKDPELGHTAVLQRFLEALLKSM